MPAALVGVLAGLGVPDTELYASVVALAVIVTLLVQALPAGWLAGRLGLLDGPAPVSPDAGPAPSLSSAPTAPRRGVVLPSTVIEMAGTRRQVKQLKVLVALCAAALGVAVPQARRAPDGWASMSPIQRRHRLDRGPEERVRFAFVAASRGSGDDCAVVPDSCGTDPNYDANYAGARAAGSGSGPTTGPSSTGAATAS